MTEEQVASLFDRTRVASEIPTSVESTGFGLYLSRLILEAHAGTISCKSQLGKGTTFTVELPLPNS